MNRDTLCVAVPAATAELCAEDLPPAKRLLTEPAQPDQPLTFAVPEDTSGLLTVVYKTTGRDTLVKRVCGETPDQHRFAFHMNAHSVCLEYTGQT